MPGTVGNTEVMETLSAEPAELLTTVSMGELASASPDSLEVDFGEDEPYNAPRRSADRYSLNRVMRDLRRRHDALTRELAKVNEAIALLESDSRAINMYRIISEGF